MNPATFGIPIKVGEFIRQASDLLAAAGVENPDLDARLLVQYVLGWPQAKLLLNFNYLLTDSQIEHLNTVISRRMNREPVSRIIGEREFWKSNFKLSPQTLDPRPDSEILVEAALKYADPAPSSILDLGTGSGCLLLSLLIEYPNARGVGLDINAEAVQIARDNAESLGLARRADFIANDWRQYAPDELFDMVVSNPPYIRNEEIATLEPEVSRFDPHAALAGGPDGLDCYRSLACSLTKWLKPRGWLFVEIGHDQAEAVKSLLAGAGMDVLDVLPDLAGSDRVVAARRP